MSVFILYANQKQYHFTQNDSLEAKDITPQIQPKTTT